MKNCSSIKQFLKCSWNFQVRSLWYLYSHGVLKLLCIYMRMASDISNIKPEAHLKEHFQEKNDSVIIEPADRDAAQISSKDNTKVGREYTFKDLKWVNIILLMILHISSVYTIFALIYIGNWKIILWSEYFSYSWTISLYYIHEKYVICKTILLQYYLILFPIAFQLFYLIILFFSPLKYISLWCYLELALPAALTVSGLIGRTKQSYLSELYY